MHFERRVQNLTPLIFVSMPADDRDGRSILLVVAKLVLQVSALGQWAVRQDLAQIRVADEPQDPSSPFSSVKYPADTADEKPGTDVVFVGTAYPPTSQPAPSQMDVSVQVGLLRKTVRVFGTRVFESAALGRMPPGPAEPLRPTPLRYELAWGGHDARDPDRIEFDARNPSGIGFLEHRLRQGGAPAPRLEVVSSLVDKATEPAGFGAIACSWSPRVELAGTYDADWRRTRAPVRPGDFDPRHHCCAHPDLYSATALRSDEPVEILGATPEGAWRFKLPSYEPRFTLEKLGHAIELPTHLDTFLIDGDERLVELTWRVSVPLPRKVEQLGVIVIRDRTPLPEPEPNTDPQPA